MGVTTRRGSCEKSVGESAVRPVSAARAEVIAVFGQTASGKSAVAEAVAERLGTAVVSADAMQV
jgi:adenylylsulfate kinase-like enzyme